MQSNPTTALIIPSAAKVHIRSTLDCVATTMSCADDARESNAPSLPFTEVRNKQYRKAIMKIDDDLPPLSSARGELTTTKPVSNCQRQPHRIFATDVLHVVTGDAEGV
jgi:hypothetical protein